MAITLTPPQGVCEVSEAPTTVGGTCWLDFGHCRWCAPVCSVCSAVRCRLTVIVDAHSDNFSALSLDPEVKVRTQFCSLSDVRLECGLSLGAAAAATVVVVAGVAVVVGVCGSDVRT